MKELINTQFRDCMVLTLGIALMLVLLYPNPSRAVDFDWRWISSGNCQTMSGGWTQIKRGRIKVTSEEAEVVCPVVTLTPNDAEEDTWKLREVWVRHVNARDRLKNPSCTLHLRDEFGDRVDSKTALGATTAGEHSLSLKNSNTRIPYVNDFWHQSDGVYQLQCKFFKDDIFVGYRTRMAD
ncbi:hypothetical protein P886_1325 [Alteromonadaceae bacterium 2753L.S.0a.02]|nr:hypothetical protein P886_1325 [Alteromonadaceae bacterium 2753L.S.0a.02]